MTKATKIPPNAIFNAELWIGSPKDLQIAINEHLKEYRKFDPNVFLEIYCELIRGEPSYGLKVNLCKIAQVMRVCSKCNLANSEHCNLLVPNVAQEKTSNAEILLALTEGLVETFKFSDMPYVWVPIDRKLHVLPVLSKKFEYWLSGHFYREQRKPIASDSISAALNQFCSKALFESPTHELSNRAAFHNGHIWYDLTNEEGEAVRIGPDGWSIVPRTPVPIFRSYSSQLPAFTPERHDSVEPDDLREGLEIVLDYINISKVNRAQRLLLMVHLVSFFIPDIPRSAVVFHGVQGTAKTSASLVFKRLVDNAMPAVQSLAKSKEELIQAIDHNYLLVLDNLTKIYDNQSDLLCGAITGTGTQTRKLYSDDDVFLRCFKRNLIFTGISVAPENPDLLDRCTLYELEKMDNESRREEIPFWTEFEKEAPFIQGTIFDVLSSAMSIKDDIKTTGLPRMADWAKWCCAITRALGIDDNDWLKAYEINRRAMTDHALLTDKVGYLLVHLLEREIQWSGIAGDLLAVLGNEAITANVSIKKDWPADPPRLGQRLKKLEVNLGDYGIEFQRDTKRTERKLHFKYCRKLGAITSDIPDKIGLERYFDDSKATEDSLGTVASKPPVDGIECISDSSDSSDSNSLHLLPKQIIESGGGLGGGARAYEARWTEFLTRTQDHDSSYTFAEDELPDFYKEDELAQLERDLKDWEKDGRVFYKKSKKKEGWRIADRGAPKHGGSKNE